MEASAVAPAACTDVLMKVLRCVMLKCFYFDASERYFISMVLQKDSSFRSHTEIRLFGKFASGYQCVEDGRSSLVFHHLPAIQPMLDLAIGIGNDPSPVPFANGDAVSAGCLGIQAGSRRDQVIQGCHGSVAAGTHLGIRMLAIIQDLGLS